MLVGLNNLYTSNNASRMKFVNQPNSANFSCLQSNISSAAALKPLNQDKFESNTVKKNFNIYFGSNAAHKDLSVAAMAPLYINNDIEMAEFKKHLKFAKAHGVEAISVDVWWGIAEKEAEGKFNWKYYEKVFKTITDHGLKVIPILSTHQCGGNVGDNVNIPIPEWTWKYLSNKTGHSKKELSYLNEHGQRISEVVPIWLDKLMMPKYQNFAKAFRDHFITTSDSSVNIKDKIDEINISTGPAGELRYPTYSENLEGEEFPKRGWFVGYDEFGKNSFRENIKTKYNGDLNRLNQAWNTQLKSFDEILPPHNNTVKDGCATDFVKTRDYVKTQYGKDFIEWYNTTLLDHGKNMLTNSYEVFKETDIPIGIKIPGIHWQRANHNTPGISEIIAGLIDGNNGAEFEHGYKGLFDMLQSVKSKLNNKLVVYCTCLEMEDEPHSILRGQQTFSMAGSLVKWMAEAAKKRGLVINGENALEGLLFSPSSWDALKKNINTGYSGITFLRLGTLNNNNHFQNFMHSFVEAGRKIIKVVA